MPDDELVTKPGGCELLDFTDKQHEGSRACRTCSDSGHQARAALGQLRLALGREHFRDVEHIRKRAALGGLVLCSLQEMLADHESVALAGHALRPPIEP